MAHYDQRFAALSTDSKNLSTRVRRRNFVRYTSPCSQMKCCHNAVNIEKGRAAAVSAVLEMTKNVHSIMQLVHSHAAYSSLVNLEGSAGKVLPGPELEHPACKRGLHQINKSPREVTSRVVQTVRPCAMAGCTVQLSMAWCREIVCPSSHTVRAQGPGLCLLCARAGPRA